MELAAMNNPQFNLREPVYLREIVNQKCFIADGNKAPAYNARPMLQMGADLAADGGVFLDAAAPDELGKEPEEGEPGELDGEALGQVQAFDGAEIDVDGEVK